MHFKSSFQKHNKAFPGSNKDPCKGLYMLIKLEGQTTTTTQSTFPKCDFKINFH